jgi:hypothetical protein
MQRKQKIAALVLFLFCIVAGGFSATMSGTDSTGKRIRISGRVTDFSNQPIVGASVQLKNSSFQNVAEATSAADGSYALTVAKGNYMALTAVKDYQIKFLEYWAWNVPANQDLEINPRFDRLEVYALNAWQPQGAYPSYQIYFRPMSLGEAGKKITAAGGMENFGKLPLMDIAPDLRLGDIAVTIDGEVVNVLKVNKILEAVGPKQDMVGYVVQAELPKQKTVKEYSIIIVTLTDHETGEKGEASLFVRTGRLI